MAGENSSKNNKKPRLPTRREFIAVGLGGVGGFATRHYFRSEDDIQKKQLDDIQKEHFEFFLRSADIQGRLGGWVSNSKTEAWFVGVNMFMSVKANQNLYLSQLSKGLRIRFLILDPGSSKVPNIAADQDKTTKMIENENTTTLDGLGDLWRTWKKQAPTAPRMGTLEIRFHDAMMHNRLYLFDPGTDDGRIVVVPYMTKASSPELPAYSIGARNGEGYYQGAKLLWNASKPLEQVLSESQDTAARFSGE